MKTYEVVKKIREESGLSKWGFYKKLIRGGMENVQPDSINRWEKTEDLKVRTAAEICKIMGVSPLIFFE